MAVGGIFDIRRRRRRYLLMFVRQRVEEGVRRCVGRTFAFCHDDQVTKMTRIVVRLQEGEIQNGIQLFAIATCNTNMGKKLNFNFGLNRQWNRMNKSEIVVKIE